MMLQTLVLVATLVVLSAAVLTSTLVTAKNAFHAVVIAKTQTAMTDATSDFISWAQKVVATNGTAANWASASEQQVSTLRPMCAGAEPKCAFAQTEQWTVTGSTAGETQLHEPSEPADATASNMAAAVDEQRISATISVSVRDATGRTLYGGKTEQVTARLLDSAPFVVITGTHDLSSAVGSMKSVEGDSGGSKQTYAEENFDSPSVTRPYGYQETRIKVTVSCVNSPSFDEAKLTSTSNDGKRLLDSSIRSKGTMVWAYESPCTPLSGVPPPPAEIDNYISPSGTIYSVEPSNESARWEKGDGRASGFMR